MRLALMQNLTESRAQAIRNAVELGFLIAFARGFWVDLLGGLVEAGEKARAYCDCAMVCSA